MNPSYENYATKHFIDPQTINNVTFDLTDLHCQPTGGHLTLQNGDLTQQGKAGWFNACQAIRRIQNQWTLLITETIQDTLTLSDCSTENYHLAAMTWQGFGLIPKTVNKFFESNKIRLGIIGTPDYKIEMKTRFPQSTNINTGQFNNFSEWRNSPNFTYNSLKSFSKSVGYGIKREMFDINQLTIGNK